MKQFEALYIDGQLVNIGTSDITLEWKSVMLSNISKLKVNHSYTIKLPMTANNRRVLCAAEDAAHDEHVLVNGGKTVIGKRMSARYYCNGIDLLGNANAYLIGTDKDYYKVVLTWGSLTALETIISEDRSLPEVFDNEGTQPTKIYWEKWKTEQISASLGDNVVWVGYNKSEHGAIVTSYTHELPSFKVTWIIDRIFKKYGVKYDFTKKYVEDGQTVTKTEQLLDALYCPMVTINDSKYVQNYNHDKWYVDKCFGYFEGNSADFTELRSNNSVFMERAFSARKGSLDRGDDRFGTVVGWCGAHQNMKYKLKIHIRVFAFVPEYLPDGTYTMSSSSNAWIQANCKLAVANSSWEEGSQLMSVDATKINYIGMYWPGLYEGQYSVYEVFYDYDEWVEVDEGDTPSGESWKDMTYDNALYERMKRVLRITFQFVKMDVSDIQFAFGNTEWVKNWNNWVDICPVITSGKAWSEAYGAITTVDEKTPLYLEPNFPDMKPIDFLKAIFYLIGAFPVIVGDTLKLTLYSELVENTSKALDWSKNVIDDNEVPDQIDFELTEWAKRNWMRYKDDDEDNPKFSGYFDIDDDYLSKETDLFTIPFLGCKMHGNLSIPIFKTGKVLKQVANPSAANERKEEVEGYVFDGWKPCILHKTSTTYPDFEWNGYTIPGGTVSVFDFDSLSFADKNSLVRHRYNVFAELLQHPYVITVSMELDEYTLGGLDMSVPVFLRQYGSYFGIISIKRKSDGLCTVKLLRIPNSLITG